jgi:hypothetical protein
MLRLRCRACSRDGGVWYSQRGFHGNGRSNEPTTTINANHRLPCQSDRFVSGGESVLTSMILLYRIGYINNIIGSARVLTINRTNFALSLVTTLP